MRSLRPDNRPEVAPVLGRVGEAASVAKQFQKQFQPLMEQRGYAQAAVKSSACLRYIVLGAMATARAHTSVVYPSMTYAELVTCASCYWVSPK